MKNLILTLTLCSFSTSAFAHGEEVGPSTEGKPNSVSARSPETKAATGSARISTRAGGVRESAAKPQTAATGTTVTRTASVSRVNLRRPTATATTRTSPTSPVGGQ